MRGPVVQRPFLRSLAVGLLALPLAANATGSTWAAWSTQTQNTGNVMSANPDWVAPTVTASTVALTNGKSVGTIGRNSTYYVYANASDAGNPASGVATVSTNVANLTASASNVPLSSGSYIVGGTTYAYRSDALTAGGTLAGGSYTYTHQSVDGAGNSRDQAGFPVAVDVTAPTAYRLSATNVAGGTAGQPDKGDVVTLTFSEPIDPATIRAGWNGQARAVAVYVTAQGNAKNSTTTWSFYDADQTLLPFGTFTGGKHLTHNSTPAVFHTTAEPSVMSLSGGVLTVTLGALSIAPGQTSLATLATAAATDMTWNPTTTATPALTDLVGNAINTGVVGVEGDAAADVDF